MANIQLVNLVTTQLVQNKRNVEFKLNKEITEGTPDTVISVLGEYTKIINDIKLWESLINEINQQKEEK